MAGRVLYCSLLCSVSLVAWADDRIHFGEEDERRWNTPPELIPEQVMKKSDTKNERLRSLFIPITANINLNTGENAHSLGFQASPGGLSYSESNSFNRPLSDMNGSSISQSQSLSFSAGTAGVGGAAVQTVGQRDPVYGNQGNVDSQAFGLGNAAASSYGTVQNGNAMSAAASSLGSLYSFASSGAGNGRFSESGSLIIRYPGQNPRLPIWTNIRPNHNNNGRLPKLNIDVKPHGVNDRRQIKLHVTTHETSWEERQPNVHIRKWRPSHTSRGIYEN